MFSNIATERPEIVLVDSRSRKAARSNTEATKIEFLNPSAAAQEKGVPHDPLLGEPR